VPAEEAAEETPTEAEGRPARHFAVELATSRPVLTAALCTGFLLLAATGLTRLDLGNPVIRGLPSDSPPREAYAQARQGFAAGILSPTAVLLEQDGIVSQRRNLAKLQRLVELQPGVAEVIGPGDQPTVQAFGAVLSKTGDAARLFVVFRSDPLGAMAIKNLRRLQRAMPRLLIQSRMSPTEASYAGDTALVAETIDDDETVGDIGGVAPLSLFVVLLVLVLFLRALVAPLYLLATSVLALMAALGLTAYVFQDFVGHQGIAYFVPFAAAVLLLSLGSDYNVFLTGRIWQEAAHRPLREAVRVAGARAATPITIVGIVLAGSFALLFLVPIQPFQQLGFAVAAGLLIDAFVVRALLVPALIVLVGPVARPPPARIATLSPLAGFCAKMASHRVGGLIHQNKGRRSWKPIGTHGPRRLWQVEHSSWHWESPESASRSRAEARSRPIPGASPGSPQPRSPARSPAPSRSRAPYSPLARRTARSPHARPRGSPASRAAGSPS
jgi:RND superfamily putative drug exporter